MFAYVLVFGLFVCVGICLAQDECAQRVAAAEREAKREASSDAVPASAKSPNYFE